MPIVLSLRDRQLLETLTLRIRLVSVAQAARSFWGHTTAPEDNARRRIAALREAGYVSQLTILSHPELELAVPVLTWQPGVPPPDFGTIAYHLKSRWTERPNPTSVVIATTASANWLGGWGGRHPRPSEGTHDLHVAAVFLRMLRDAPARARLWQSEAQLLASRRRRGGRLPDAMIVGPREKIVIEFGGAYSKRKLAEFHNHCATRRLPYEVW